MIFLLPRAYEAGIILDEFMGGSIMHQNLEHSQFASNKKRANHIERRETGGENNIAVDKMTSLDIAEYNS